MSSTKQDPLMRQSRSQRTCSYGSNPGSRDTSFCVAVLLSSTPFPRGCPFYYTLILCVESVFTVLRERFCVENCASGRSLSSGQVRYPRRSSDDLSLHLYPGTLRSRRGSYPLLPDRGGMCPGIVLFVYALSSFMYVFPLLEFQSRCYREI